ncbi:MAG TPA: hypothetical protein VHX14_20715 [Thermoanaerobaculia bacterium]|nr:hypothetical protein [Thermoanaerobaculia bacterium]
MHSRIAAHYLGERNVFVMRRRFAGLIALIVCVCLVNPSAIASTKQPWEWTPQERAEARRDPAKRLERLHDGGSERRALGVSAKSVAPVADVIDGSRHPELFFETELFEYLVQSAFVTLPEIYPQVIRQRSSDLFRNPADWKRFASIVANYSLVLKEEHGAANALDRSAISAIQSRKCVAEARALREARRAFGKTRFDRMLYETVPVSMSRSYSIDTDFETSINSALGREERCQ